MKKILFIVTLLLAFLILQSTLLAQTEIVYQTWTIPEIAEEAELIKDFEEQNPDIKVTVEVVPFDQHFNKLYISSRAGKAPDVLADTPEWVHDLASRGVTRSIDEFIQKEGPEFVAQYVPIAWDFGLYHNEQHALPWRIGGSGTYYNPEHFEEAGITAPESWNWDDLLEISSKLTVEGERYGYGFCGSVDIVQPMLWHYANFLFQNGGRLSRDNRAIFSEKEGVEALEFMVDMLNKHKVVPPSISAWTYKDLFDAFALGKISMFSDGPWWMATMLAAYPDLKAGVANNPVQRTSGSPAGGTMLAMSTSTKSPEAAWRFIKFMTSPASLSRWAYAGKFIPPAVAVLQEDWLQAPDMRPFVLQLQAPNNQVIGNHPRYSELRDSLQVELQKALMMEKSSQDALNTAAEMWNNILSETTK
jgi:multiple sugar transport system substrate-binding protein